MTFNQFMHPDNIYKNKPPNFKQLASRFSSFRQFCRIDLSGKFVFDFKNPDAIRTLTWALLKNDFALDVDIPLDCLVPRIPLRLNYVLWLHDLMRTTLPETKQRSVVDIGTGSTCIYPLLGAKQFGWNFLAIDRDLKAIEFAKKNVERNNLGGNIRVLQVPDDHGLEESFKLIDDKNESFDCCMCNPPFYDINPSCSDADNNRRPCRPAPHSATVARINETRAEGGEFGFVSRLIEDSCKLKNKIKIYTSMLGKKSSIGPLKQILNNSGVVAMCETTFCQGRTQRWALAWTFDVDSKLQLLQQQQQQTTSHQQKSKTAGSYNICVSCTQLLCLKNKLNYFDSDSILQTFQLTTQQTFCLQNILGILEDLKINFKTINNNSSNNITIQFQCFAYENTWCHQRRKRRKQNSGSQVNSKCLKEQETTDATVDTNNDQYSISLINNSCSKDVIVDTKSVLVEFLLKIRFDFDEDVSIVFQYVMGENGKDLLHQIRQYILNLISG